MNAVQISLILFAAAAFLPGIASLRAADQSPALAKPAEPAEATEPRRPFRDMSPEEREARFKEMQEKFGPAPFSLQELRRMPPEERQAALRKWREKGFTLEERQKRRLQIKERLTKQIAELRARKALTEEERLRLERLQLIASRFERLSRPATNAFGAPSNNAGPGPKNLK